MSAALEFEKVDILFPTPGLSRRKRGSAMKAAIGLLDAGQDRTSIESATGVVVGVQPGQPHRPARPDLGADGLVGFRQVDAAARGQRAQPVTRGRVLVCDGRRDGGRRELRREHPCAAAPRAVAMIFQQFALLPWRTVRRERRRSGSNCAATRPRRGGASWTRSWQLVGLERLGGSLWSRTVGRHAATRRPRTRVRDRRRDPADGRAVLRARPADPHQAAGRIAGAAGAACARPSCSSRHDLDEALKLGNQISIMEGGRIVQTGKPEDIVLRPANAYVGEFVQHMNPLSVLNGRMVMRPWSELGRATVTALARPGAPVRCGARRAGPSGRGVARRPAACAARAGRLTAPA